MRASIPNRQSRRHPKPEDIVCYVRYSLERVQAARAAGEALQIEWALPTGFDGLLRFMDDMKVLQALERLPDVRKDPTVPLMPLILCVWCRFLMGLQSFAEVGEVLFAHQEILLRLGFTLELVEEGAYPSTGHTPCDVECLSEAIRHLEWQALREVLVLVVKHWRTRKPKLFVQGRYLVDSNHFQSAVRHTGQEQEGRVRDSEEKVCVLMLYTPKGLIPVDFRIAKVGLGGEGETTCGQTLIEGAVATYGKGFIKELVWDRGYLDGAWLAMAGEQLDIVWVMGVKEDMVIYEDALAISQMPDSVFEAGRAPQFDDERKRPKRELCRIEGLETWSSYGKPLVGLVIRDRYPDKVCYQVIVTPQTRWSATQIHERHRCRWDIEESFNEMTACWQLGQKLLARRGDLYRALVALMVVLYGLLQLYARSGAQAQTLRQHQRAFKLGPTHLLVRCGGYCALMRVHEVNELINMGRSP
jgi:hypothetical protein